MTDATCTATVEYRSPIRRIIGQESTTYHCSLLQGHDGWHVCGPLTWPDLGAPR